MGEKPQTIGRFEIQRELGRGAQSAVYLAWDPQLRREVAIKTLHFSRADAARNQALLDEARAVSRLSHPNIVPVFDMGEQDGSPYLVFELVTGPTLGELLRRDGRLPAAHAADMMRQVLDALAQAHAAGLIHRDLKPSNILIDAAGKPRVMDFGVAARVEDGGSGKGLAGTPAYMAPEYVDQQRISPQLDVYAAGLVLFEMLTGERAVKGESLAQIAYQIAHAPVALPIDLGVDDTLVQILAKSVAKDPALRLASAQQMKKLLDDYLGAAATPISGGDESAELRKQSTLDFLMRRMRHKADFPALSDSVVAINKVTGSDKDSVHKLSSTILKDYGLTNKILRLVNSAFYRTSGGGNISTVSRAVVVLGFDAVRNVAITVLLFDHLQDKANARELKEAFLRANLAGVLARDASRKFMAREAEQAFVCALFHSLGQMLAQFYFPEEVLEIRKVMLQRQCGEEQAAVHVLGIGFSELGIGIAKHWGFPEEIVGSLRPLPEGSPKKPQTHEENLRLVAGFANEVCAAIAGAATGERGRLAQEVGGRFAAAMPFTEKQLQGVIESAYGEVSELAAVLHVNLKQSPFARQVRHWIGVDKSAAHGPASDGMAATVLGESALLEEEEAPPPADSEAAAQHAQSVLTAGIQDISNTLVDDFSLNDVLRITLETMYRAMGFQRVLLCLKDARAGAMQGRFGFGPDSTEVVKRFRFSVAFSPDVFHVAISKGVDIIITDIDDPKIADKVPTWYRKTMSAKTFVLFPLTIKGNPVALIYADRDQAGSISIPEKELTLLKTLRNQALLAIKQSM